MTRGKLQAFIALNITALGVAGAWASDYVVKPGDTLSTVANKLIPGRVWGVSGSLQKILALNPTVKNSDLIFPGQQINFPGNTLTENTTNEKRALASETAQPAAPKEQAVSSPSPEFKPVEAPSDATNDDIDHHVTAGLGYHFKTYSAVDSTNASTAKLFTSSDVEFDASWAQEWDRKLSTYFEFGFEKLTFAPSNNPSKSLLNASQSPAHFTLGADYKASSSLILRTSASYGQQLFTGTQSGNIAIDSVFIPVFAEELIFTAYTRGRTSVGVEAGGSYLLGSSAGSYSVNSGYAVNGAVFLNQNFGPKNKDSLTLSVGYENTQQNTSLVNQTVGDAVAKIMFSMPIFGGDK